MRTRRPPTPAVEWHCRTDNAASASVARRLGMHLDGVLRGEYLYQGVRHDTQVWSLIAPDRRAAS
jgi:RimJ/RimL family protein N-acetyltransferase